MSEMMQLLDDISEGLDTCSFCEEKICLVHTATLPPDIHRAIQATEQAPPTPTSVERLLMLEEEEKHHSHGRLTREVMQLREDGSGRSDDSTSSSTSRHKLPC